MFKRVIWVGIGAAAGSVSTVWAQKKVRAQVDKVAAMATPAHLADTARSRVVDVRDTVVAAVAEGRSTKRVSEAQMKANVQRRFDRNE